MTKLTREDVLRLAALAHLELSSDEVDKFQKEITEILSYVQQLQDTDVSELEPTYQVTGLKNVMRPDEVEDYEISQAELFKNLPQRDGDSIKVRRVL